MISKIKISNFFSFSQEESILLNLDTNILIGINGSGKSNFIKAIEILKQAVSGDLQQLLPNLIPHFNQKQTNLIKLIFEFDKKRINDFIHENIKADKQKSKFRFPKNPVYEITITINKQGYDITEFIYNESNKKEITTPFIYLKFENNKGIISTTNSTNSELVSVSTAFKEGHLVLSQISEKERYFPLFMLKEAILNIVSYGSFDTTVNSLARKRTPFYLDKKLLPTGENLARLLNNINSQDIKSYEKIIAALQKINPNFKDLIFDTNNAQSILLALKEKNLSRVISVENISDGTLRFLLLISILYNPHRGTIVCIDEPETGLHPDMIQAVSEGIKYAAQTSQIIIATHSPLLLNNFELEDLLIFEKNEENATIIVRKSEEDFPNWEGTFLVGQLWLRNQLGGVRW